MTKFWLFLTNNVWSVLSGLASLYFLWVVHQHVGFPPTNPLTPTSAIYLALFVFFLAAPFVQRLRLGRLIEFEAKVEEVRTDVKEVRTETRELISTVSAVATAISASVNQSVILNFPSSEWAQAAREEMSTAFGDTPEPPRTRGRHSGIHGTHRVRPEFRARATANGHRGRASPNPRKARFHRRSFKDARKVSFRSVAVSNLSIPKSQVSADAEFFRLRAGSLQCRYSWSKDFGWCRRRSGWHRPPDTPRTQG